MQRGKLITFEGIDGVGKSTQAAVLESFLLRQGIDVKRTCEPGGVPVGEKIRQILLHEKEDLSNLAELLLFFAARAEHVHRVVRPALEQGQWVICDRFIDASYAYQGGGRKIKSGWIDTLVKWVASDLSPDLTILLNLPSEHIHDRIPSNQHDMFRASVSDKIPDNFESEEKPFFERVRNVYLKRAEQEPGRIEVIDASPDKETVSGEIIALVKKRWPETDNE